MTPLYFAVLFPLTFTAFGGMIVSINRREESFRSPAESGFWARINQQQDASMTLMSYAFSCLPGWMQAACTLVIFYTMINFIVGIAALSEGQPQGGNGRYWLDDRGRYVRNLSEAEFRRLRAREARLCSGHMLPFSLFPAAWFIFVRPRLDQDRAPSTESGYPKGDTP